MELSLLLIKQIGAMFIMMFIGVLLIRLKVLKEEHGTVISKILLYAVVPCAIINSYQIEFSTDKLTGLGIAVLGALVVHIVFFLLERILRRPLKLTPTEGASIIYVNAGNLIMPLVLATLGPEWVFYASGFLAVQQILMWTHGKAMMGGDGFDIRKIAGNVNIIAIVIGITCFLTGFRFPEVLGTAVSNTAGTIAPLSMILVGMLLGTMRFREIVGNPRAYFITALRLILFPLVIVMIFAFSGLTRIHPEAGNILMIILLATSSTSATTIIQFAQLYADDPGYASVINVVTVIFCIVTIPLMIGLYQALV